MHRITHKLWVGSQADFEKLDAFGTEWAVVHAARDPWHRQVLGYTGRGAPSDHPEYLFARRGNRLMLNLVDADDPKYISAQAVNAAMVFIDEWMEQHAKLDDEPDQLLICCNQGGSRAPTLGMLYIAWLLPSRFEEAEAEYRKTHYPGYNPGRGMREFARIHWPYFHERPGYMVRHASPNEQAPAAALDKAEQIWQRLCETMKTDPALARDQLMEVLVRAFSAAETQERDNHGQERPGSPGTG